MIEEMATDLSASYRALRGGGFYFNSDYPCKCARLSGDPSGAYFTSGFRLTMIPEPGTGLLVIAGLLGLASWRRKHA